MKVFAMLVTVIAVLGLTDPLEAGQRRVERTVTKARTSAVCACGCDKAGCRCGRGRMASVTVQTKCKTHH